jgi:hypothetical protein
MTVDPTCPSRATRQGSWPAAGAVETPVRARRRGHREPHSTPVQQVGCAAVDASSAAVEDASLATSRWCRSRDCRRRAKPGRLCCCCAVVAGAVGAVVLAFPLPRALTLAFAAIVGVGGRRGRGHLRTWRFLRRRAWRQLLLRRAPSSSSRSLRTMWKEGNGYDRLIKIFM